ncbi:hypothetical protein MRB53_032961 [Persea americana]|uniref:Uncharacterized protein n=1 Tax=Persea americana TaxID=3435 RepID=A0ACC2KT74_PERAE|nr:hypothetical protein MRB53_032961 [Persea americana]
MCHETEMGMAAARWSRQGWPPSKATSLESMLGMAVAVGSRPGAAVGELGLLHPLGTESLDAREDLVCDGANLRRYELGRI